MKRTNPRPLDKMLLRLLLLRLFLPSLVVTLLTVGVTGYVVGHDLGNRQLLLARSLAHTADNYLRNASRVLGTVAQIAETATPEELVPYMRATWRMYGYFDVISRLDENGAITLLIPSTSHYPGMDASYQSYFQKASGRTGATISQPFNSPYTKLPTVYMSWPLTDGGMIIAELNLGALQQAITSEHDEAGQFTVFVTDRTGALLAHPQPELVAQQTNLGDLEIVQRGVNGEAILLYPVDRTSANTANRRGQSWLPGPFVLGSVTQVDQTQWLVVAQMPLSAAYASYAWSVGLALVIAPIIWLAMILSFRQQLDRHVVLPLTRLSKQADILATGESDPDATQPSVPAAFAEVDALSTNFERMSQAIQARQAALQAREKQLRRKTRQQEQLLETASHLTESLDTKEVMTRIGTGAREILEAHGCAIYLLEPDAEKLTPVVTIGPSCEEAIASTPINVKTSLAGEAVKAKRGIIFSGASGRRRPGSPAEPPLEQDMHAIAAPFIVDDRVLGAMCLNRTGWPFSDEDLALTETFATYAATALKNAQAHDEIQREVEERKRAQQEIRQRTAQLEALRQVGLEITTQLDPETLLHSITSRAVELLEGTSGGLYLYRPDQDVIEWTVTVGEEPVPVGTTLRRGEGLSGKVWEMDKPLIVNNYRHWEGRAAVFDALPNTAIVGAPVHGAGEFLGVLVVEASPPHAFSPADAELLDLFATQAVIAIQNARLFEQEREQRGLAEALEEAAATVNSTLHLDQVLDRILEQVERVVPGDACNIMLVEGEDIVRAVRWRGYEQLGVVHDISGFTAPIADYPTLARMVESGKPVVAPDVASDPVWSPSAGWEWLHSYVGSPIRVGGVTVGFLNVASTQRGQFGPADAQRLEAFANHAAAAIENARLYRRLLNYTEQLERRVQERTAQLQAQYARLDAILRSSSDGVIVTDAEGEVIQVNPVAHAWLNRTLSPEDAERLREAIQDLVHQVRTETPDGEHPGTILELTGLDLELKAAPLSEPGGQEATAVVAVHDISHLKALDRMKSRFVSNVSHELRTPVTTIKLYATLLQQMSQGDRNWDRYLKSLAQEADRQARLVENILQISRIETGRMEIHPRRIPLNELVEVTVRSHEVLAQNRGLTLEQRPDTPGPSALVDPERMMQVLNNLVENAIRYTPQGGTVTVTTRKEKTEGRTWATVTVTDTGIGISEQELPHIFEPFSRGERPRLMQISGTGLGLAIVKEIVELHGGRVTVESQVDAGSTFTVRLPITD